MGRPGSSVPGEYSIRPVSGFSKDVYTINNYTALYLCGDTHTYFQLAWLVYRPYAMEIKEELIFFFHVELLHNHVFNPGTQE